MAGLRCYSDEGQQAHSTAQPTETGRITDADVAAHYSDDERSLAADSWSVKSEHGSVLDLEDQRQTDAECLAASNFRASDYRFDKEEDAEAELSTLGLLSHWDAAYAEDLTNFLEHGDTGEIWFGEEVMETMAAWTAKICTRVATTLPMDPVEGFPSVSVGDSNALSEVRISTELASWNVLDIGTGNGILLHALAKHGFVELTGTDYSEVAVELARAVADRSGHSNINFMVDDVLETKLQTQFMLITDKGTLDAIGLHPEGLQRRIMYWKALSKLVAPGGVLVITSCNSTKDELVDEACSFMQSPSIGTFFSRHEDSVSTSSTSSSSSDVQPVFHYIDHVRTYPTFCFGGAEGSKVSSVAFLRTLA